MAGVGHLNAQVLGLQLLSLAGLVLQYVAQREEQGLIKKKKNEYFSHENWLHRVSVCPE